MDIAKLAAMSNGRPPLGSCIEIVGAFCPRDDVQTAKPGLSKCDVAYGQKRPAGRESLIERNMWSNEFLFKILR